MKKDTPTYVLGFMVALCVVFGVGISAVNYATQGMLAKNESLHRNRVLAQAFMLDVERETPEAYEQALEGTIESKEVTKDGRVWNVHTDTRNGNIGIEFRGMGFWDRIRGVLVMTKDLSEVVHLKILEQKETPGLGARIEEAWFTDQFKGIDIDWKNPPDKRIAIGGNGKSGKSNRVDAITGATQTSMALEKMLNAELEEFGMAD